MSDNELIAEFMGATKCQLMIKSIGLVDAYECEEWKVPTEEMLYEVSWDWLMDVVEKIENIIKDGFTPYSVEIEFNECVIKDSSDGFGISYFEGDTKIQATYKAVVEFIKWYNVRAEINK